MLVFEQDAQLSEILDLETQSNLTKVLLLISKTSIESYTKKTISKSFAVLKASKVYKVSINDIYKVNNRVLKKLSSILNTLRATQNYKQNKNNIKKKSNLKYIRASKNKNKQTQVELFRKIYIKLLLKFSATS